MSVQHAETKLRLLEWEQERLCAAENQWRSFLPEFRHRRPVVLRFFLRSHLFSPFNTKIAPHLCDSSDCIFFRLMLNRNPKSKIPPWCL